MVKIRLRRTGAKNRPFYRVVVAKSTAGRNGAFIENIGSYNPVVKPTHVNIDGDRALHWLLQGAQPTETMAILLNKAGVLDQFFAQRPNARKGYSFLDKRTAATSMKSAVDASEAAPKAKAKPEPVPEPEPPLEPVDSVTPAEEPVATVEEAMPEETETVPEPTVEQGGFDETVEPPSEPESDATPEPSEK